MNRAKFLFLSAFGYKEKIHIRQASFSYSGTEGHIERFCYTKQHDTLKENGGSMYYERSNYFLKLKTVGPSSFKILQALCGWTITFEWVDNNFRLIQDIFVFLPRFGSLELTLGWLT